MAISPLNSNGLMCSDLPTQPIKDNRLILVTGATGYIGGRMVTELLERGYRVRVMARNYTSGLSEKWPDAEICYADANNYHELKEALIGVHTAYYLIHSLKLGYKYFETMDIEVANNFRKASEGNRVQSIIYLSGLGKESKNLSPHLSNRMKVAEALKSGNIPVIVIRAGMIIGSGSASYEILKNLIYNTPIFFIPKWAKTKCQPIAVRDVIKYLVGIMENNPGKSHNFDIGGSDILTYVDNLKIFSSMLGKRRFFFPGLINWTGFYGYFASLLTPVPGPITKVLIEGCKNEVICSDNKIQKYVNIKVMSFKEAIIFALSREEMDMVSTRWSDAYPPAHSLAIKLHELKNTPKFISSYHIISNKSPEALFHSFCKVGGKNGWFQNNWMWRMRGILDKLMMGVGTSRGRRSTKELLVNDVIDFWRVENIKKNKSLLLRAEMKVPGKAWLEFNIEKRRKKNTLFVKAYFDPNGFKGVIYWYNFLPFHYIIFKNLLKQIVQRSKGDLP